MFWTKPQIKSNSIELPDVPRSPEAGFTLLEVIVAFAIAALSLGVLFQTFGGGLSNIRESMIITHLMTNEM